jgi:hypothetical protein
MLHLLREASLDLAVAAVPETGKIYQQNLETMRRLGVAGLAALGFVDPQRRLPAARSTGGDDRQP